MLRDMLLEALRLAGCESLDEAVIWYDAAEKRFYVRQENGWTAPLTLPPEAW